MSDAGEKLRERIRRQIEFRAEVPMSAMRDIEVIVRDELERAAVEADKMLGHNHKLPAAIRKLKE